MFFPVSFLSSSWVLSSDFVFVVKSPRIFVFVFLRTLMVGVHFLLVLFTPVLAVVMVDELTLGKLLYQSSSLS